MRSLSSSPPFSKLSRRWEPLLLLPLLLLLRRRFGAREGESQQAKEGEEMQIPLAPLVRLPIQKKGKRLEKEGKVFSSSSCTVHSGQCSL